MLYSEPLYHVNQIQPKSLCKEVHKIFMNLVCPCMQAHKPKYQEGREYVLSHCFGPVCKRYYEILKACQLQYLKQFMSCL